ncbi:uncharacterized protein RHIMIDRAFT_105250 [Rhizopus microsporus ATCC 52813]|uniref:Uncharacterized protein n=1 Tax=Rhizopus microsporus ATCC 52813 TaxID=1340429 RepID=A0A2G4T137_RHIZD|nr:uncharacterized protein RHIMIDRAFT_105250 [Rhizopus microsporus ATCC 52813]PHZ14732.1 hypothetical protein RHIMIDRAFT_105250 [Rhizopus microsporus ATCC 52813]
MLVPHPLVSSSKKRDIDTQAEKIKHDGVALPGLDISLTTIVKREAVKYHEKFILNPDGLYSKTKKNHVC